MNKTTVWAVLIAVVPIGGAIAYNYVQSEAAAVPFDAAEYLAASLAVAAKEAPGAAISGLRVDKVDPAGKVHALDDGMLVVYLRGANTSPAGDAGRLLGSRGYSQPACAGASVKTDIHSGYRGGRRLATAYRSGSAEGCGPVVGQPPRCSVKDIWSRATRAGSPTPALANISLTTESQKGQPRYKWRFRIVNRQPNGLDVEVFGAYFPDDC